MTSDGGVTTEYEAMVERADAEVLRCVRGDYRDVAADAGERILEAVHVPELLTDLAGPS